MGALFYCLARAFVAFLQALPLRAVARLGRAGGAMACGSTRGTGASR